jgi:hypothetical protein
MRLLPILPLLFLLPTLPAGAGRLCAAPKAEKSGYSLSHPTPDALLRELCTDRPDATEGPFTVDAGRVQLEMDFASVTASRLDGNRERSWEVAPFNLRLGLLPNLEVGLFVSPHVWQAETPRGGTRTVRSGVGDTGLRAKVNFWGNDGGGSAGGIIADLMLPTAAAGLGADRVGGAVIFPVAFDFEGGWGLGAMTGVELRPGGPGRGYEPVWITTATAGRDLTESLAGYIELTSEAGDGPHVATFNLGCTWRMNRHTQFDAGANLGVSQAAADALLFTGVTRRF